MSWSKLTPYRLVTTGSDGLARMWDIREAAINRYGAHVGKRADYVAATENGRSTDGSAAVGASPAALASAEELLPPLPLPMGGGPGINGAGAQGSGEGNGNEGNGADGAQAGGDNIQPGQFVRNDMLDEGVRLVTKLQHGAPANESLPGTRSRRKAVRVICIARCPKGGHFATGAEDGICRVWSEEEGNVNIERRDAKHTTNLFHPGRPSTERRSTRGLHQSTEGAVY